MKKLLLTLVLLSAGFWNRAHADNTDVSNIENVVYITPFTASAGSEIFLSVKMKNTKAIRGFQFDLYLPKGMTAVRSSIGRIQGSLSEGRLPDEDAHDLTFSEQPDGAIRFLCSSQYDETFTGTDGEVATLRVNVDASMDEGNYSILLKDITLTETDITVFYTTELVESTVSITAPGDNRVVLDENNIEDFEDAEDVNVRVNRTIVAGVWNTLCLPFSMTEEQVTGAFGNGVQIAEFTEWEVDDTGDEQVVKLTFTEGITAIERNTPYLIKTGTGLTEFTVDGVDIAPDRDRKGNLDEPYVDVKLGKLHGYFTGSYMVKQLEPNMLFLNNNSLWFCTSSNTMKAFRGYFELDGVEYAGARLSMTVEPNTDGVHSVAVPTQQNGQVYDLQGRKADGQHLHKGLYIKGGQKVVIK